MKNVFVFMLIAALLCCAAQAEDIHLQAYRGSAMPDFTVLTADGNEFTLSEALKTRKAVIISLWATWCGVCEKEFPSIQAAYEKWQDDVTVIAISIEEADTDEILTAYAQAHGLTFPLACDMDSYFRSTFTNGSVPVNIAVDRFGNIAFLEVGSAPFEESFDLLIKMLCADSYTGTVIIDGYPEPAEKAGFLDRRENRTCTDGC